jgi:hypothetical protein
MTIIMKIVLLGCLMCCLGLPAAGSAASYGRARTAVPVLNTPAISAVFGGRDGKTLKSDRCGQVRELEFIALPGTVFRILSEVRDGTYTVFRVTTDDYPSADRPLYLDSRFIDLQQDQPPPRRKVLPTRQEILASLRAAGGSPYVWGGNLQDGVNELAGFFYGGITSGTVSRRLLLSGLDCSGLLYQATGGWTPRNTSQLISYGTGVKISGRNVREIGGLLEPLDLIVWNGHVLIVLDRETIIESRLECGKPGNGGVATTALLQRLSEVMRTRRPVDVWPVAGKQRDVFVVRRWYGP